jgi:hypothetical protein
VTQERSYLPNLYGALLIVAVFAGGYATGFDRARSAAEQQAHIVEIENVKLAERVGNDWARATDYLLGRVRNGWVPDVPKTNPLRPTPKGGPTDNPDGRPADPVSAATCAADLATCGAERARVIEDCQRTTLQLRGLQTWAR